MDTKQALQLVDEMVARAPGNRDEHLAAMRAIQTLHQAINPKPAGAVGQADGAA